MRLFSLVLVVALMLTPVASKAQSSTSLSPQSTESPPESPKKKSKYNLNNATKEAIGYIGPGTMLYSSNEPKGGFKFWQRPATHILKYIGDFSEYTTGTRRFWPYDFAIMNGFTFLAILHQGSIQHGLIDNPQWSNYRNNLNGIKWYDHDSVLMELVHPVAGFGWYAYFKKRGYSTETAFASIFAMGLVREWGFKAWGQPPSLDDPFMFTGGALVAWTLERQLGVDYSKWDIYPVTWFNSRVGVTANTPDPEKTAFAVGRKWPSANTIYLGVGINL